MISKYYPFSKIIFSENTRTFSIINIHHFLSRFTQWSLGIVDRFQEKRYVKLERASCVASSGVGGVPGRFP